MVSSLLNKLANYTNLTQGVREHEEEAENEDGVRRVPVMVNSFFYSLLNLLVSLVKQHLNQTYLR